jgi:hypothetical protein
MKIGTFCLMLILFVFVSCSKNDNEDLVLFLWNQTGCADPWNTRPSDPDEDTSEAIVFYLFDNGVEDARIIRFAYDESIVTGCLACSCTTGTVIYVETTQTNSSKMEALGFKRDI